MQITGNGNSEGSLTSDLCLENSRRLEMMKGKRQCYLGPSQDTQNLRTKVDDLTMSQGYWNL